MVVCLGPVVQTVGNAINQIKFYPVGSIVWFGNIYAADSVIRLLNNQGQVGSVGVIQPLNSWGLSSTIPYDASKSALSLDFKILYRQLPTRKILDFALIHGPIPNRMSYLKEALYYM